MSVSKKLFFVAVLLLSELCASCAFSQAFSQLISLNCTAQEEVPSQPCAGVNTRELKIDISPEAQTFKETRTYGGCYPLSEIRYGEISDISEQANVLIFNLIAKGRLWPVGDPSPIEEAKIPAKLDLATNTLTLDTSRVWKPFQNANVLKCQP